MQVAEDLGMKVERRPIPEEELETFEEAGACGTAAVISPVGVLAMEDEKITLGDGGIGPVAQKFYDLLTGIQYGKLEDRNGWTSIVPKF